MVRQFVSGGFSYGLLGVLRSVLRLRDVHAMMLVIGGCVVALMIELYE